MGKLVIDQRESNLFVHTFLIVIFDFMEKSIGLTENQLVIDQRESN